MNDIDKITLELFTNKTHYKKYLSKIEPDNYNEIKEFREKCIEYKHEILVKIEELLTTTTTNEFLNSQDPFFIFTSELIKEIERKKEVYFEEEEEESENYDDEDVEYDIRITYRLSEKTQIVEDIYGLYEPIAAPIDTTAKTISVTTENVKKKKTKEITSKHINKIITENHTRNQQQQKQ
jgi:hypothetical protein